MICRKTLFTTKLSAFLSIKHLIYLFKTNPTVFIVRKLRVSIILRIVSNIFLFCFLSYSHGHLLFNLLPGNIKNTFIYSLFWILFVMMTIFLHFINWRTPMNTFSSFFLFLFETTRSLPSSKSLHNWQHHLLLLLLF